MKNRLRTIAKVFFVVTWLLLFVHFVFFTLITPFLSGVYNGPDDVSRRVTAPNGSKTALLVRDFSFMDLNFRLFTVETSYAELPGVEEAIWSSCDYEPTTRNWHEDIEWSADSLVVAVIVEDEYVFAYNFETDQPLEDPERIKTVLQSRETLQE
ncbi:MAG: hypothetical protein GY832_00820 [Chloroflexi bacterium]|nr:hypothetical protein [Chloroflexota bacterium]